MKEWNTHHQLLQQLKEYNKVSCILLKHSEFIAWLAQGNLVDFYSTMRWSNWQKDAESVSFDEGILIYPYLWTKECNIETASKRVVPFIEIVSMNEEFAGKL